MLLVSAVPLSGPARRARSLLVGMVLAMVAVMAVAGPVSAHTDLLQASPGPGQKVGGTVDFIDLAFLDKVSDVAIAVASDGRPVPGTVTVPDGQIIRFVFDQPLSSPGRYDVTYQRTSTDFDRTNEGYFFTYEPTAPQAFHLGQVATPTGGGAGRNWVRLGALAVLVLALAGLGFLYLTRIESRRAARPGGEPGTSSGPGTSTRPGTAPSPGAARPGGEPGTSPEPTAPVEADADVEAGAGPGEPGRDR